MLLWEAVVVGEKKVTSSLDLNYRRAKASVKLEVVSLTAATHSTWSDCCCDTLMALYFSLQKANNKQTFAVEITIVFSSISPVKPCCSLLSCCLSSRQPSPLMDVMYPKLLLKARSVVWSPIATTSLLSVCIALLALSIQMALPPSITLGLLVWPMLMATFSLATLAETLPNR